jgi:uncharacterized membrane protein
MEVGDGIMVVLISAIVFSILIVIVILFQIALALGMPWVSALTYFVGRKITVNGVSVCASGTTRN